MKYNNSPSHSIPHILISIYQWTIRTTNRWHIIFKKLSNRSFFSGLWIEPLNCTIKNLKPKDKTMTILSELWFQSELCNVPVHLRLEVWNFLQMENIWGNVPLLLTWLCTSISMRTSTSRCRLCIVSSLYRESSSKEHPHREQSHLYLIDFSLFEANSNL